MIKEELLAIIKRVYYETRKNKRYGVDQMAFESDLVCQLMRFMKDIYCYTFRIDHNYAFLTSIPKWREIFATFYQGRMADHMICDPLKPYIEMELSDRTYNNREGKGSQAAINQVLEDICEVTEGYSKPARIIKFDISGCFPSAQWDNMEKCFVDIIDKYEQEIKAEYVAEYPDMLRWLSMINMQSNPANHCVLRTPKHLWHENIEARKSQFTKDEGVGAPIGRLSSQHSLGLYLNPIVKWLNETCGIKTVLFVDDFALVVPERLHQYALSLIPVLRQKLAEIGMKLNEKKFYDQPYYHGLEFLGSHLKPWRIHVNNKTYARAIERIREYNALRRNEKIDVLESFISSFNSYTGLLKNRTDYKRIIYLRNTIHKDWWLFVEWDNRKLCVVARDGYKHRDLLERMFGRQRKRKRKFNNTNQQHF